MRKHHEFNYEALIEKLQEIFSEDVGGNSHAEKSMVRYHACTIAIGLGTLFHIALLYEEQDGLQFYWEATPQDAQQGWNVKIYIKTNGYADIYIQQQPNNRSLDYKDVPIDSVVPLVIEPLSMLLSGRM